MKFDISKILDKFVSSFPIVIVLIVYLFLSENEIISIKDTQKDFVYLWASISLLVFSYLLGIIIEMLSFSLIKIGVLKKYILRIAEGSDQQKTSYDIVKFFSLEIGFISGLVLNLLLLKGHAYYVFFIVFFIAMFVTFLIVLWLYCFVTKS